MASDPKLTHAVDQATASARGLAEAGAAFYSSCLKKLVADGMLFPQSHEAATAMAVEYVRSAMLPPTP